ncbi:hypothetical protein [Dysgonomonas gadei]|uniref:Lipoprotein n=1 Tax=Dysgonomonas gadei ATCC BAA-286 TaxID=742766 RepID=F5J232_9BACT|nr:hypothetical protein [Dysgonomonas gadei]EGK00288.1 hypothetical protein HMPREF9455_03427 [Dysgonomonas gadei ATCC BAA-286]
MKYITISLLTLLIVIFVGCSSQRVKPSANIVFDSYEQHFIDSVLQIGLDNEALFTLLGDLKPMSSLVTFNYPIANNDSTKVSSSKILDRSIHGKYLDRLYAIVKAINKSSIPDLQLVLIPYQTPQKKNRILQLSVVRKSSLDSLLKAKEEFFGQFGLVPGTDPNVVVSTIECSDKFERWRGYGYLFGYPDYAVDFFINAFLETESTGKFVERNAFRIPTYSMPEMGNFVYTYPKEHTPTAEVDSAIYYKGVHILDNYRTLRNKYMNADSTVQSYKLLQDFYRSSK